MPVDGLGRIAERRDVARDRPRSCGFPNRKSPAVRARHAKRSRRKSTKPWRRRLQGVSARRGSPCTVITAPFTAARRNISSAIHSRIRSPKTSTSPSTWLSCAWIASNFRSSSSARQLEADRELLARRRDRIARQEDVERLELHRSSGRPSPGSRSRRAAERLAARRRGTRRSPNGDTLLCALVSRHAVGAERQDVSGRTSTHDRAHLGGARPRPAASACRRRRAHPGTGARVTPRISRLRSSSFVRTSAIDEGGHRSSSIEPPSPRVAVTSTTRSPRSTASAISPAVR